MPPPYHPIHWPAFTAIPYAAQGPVGEPPAAWVARYGLFGVPNGAALPNAALTRYAVRDICRNPATNVLFGYVCAMAWGGQGGNGRTPANVLHPWAQNVQIAQILGVVRAGGLPRDAAYGAFVGAIPHLGPSFFTKLLYFFSPLPNFYIMDSQVTRAVMLLTGNWIAQMNGAHRQLLAPSNNRGTYRVFCEEVDLIAGQLACTGQTAEERLFSQGGHNPWPWRAYLDQQWPSFAAGYRYAPPMLHATYPHIPLADF